MRCKLRTDRIKEANVMQKETDRRVAPPVYRPQTAPPAMQPRMKNAIANPLANRPAAPPVYNPQRGPAHTLQQMPGGVVPGTCDRWRTNEHANAKHDSPKTDQNQNERETQY